MTPGSPRRVERSGPAASSAAVSLFTNQTVGKRVRTGSDGSPCPPTVLASLTSQPLIQKWTHVSFSVLLQQYTEQFFHEAEPLNQAEVKIKTDLIVSSCFKLSTCCKVWIFRVNSVVFPRLLLFL